MKCLNHWISPKYRESRLELNICTPWIRSKTTILIEIKDINNYYPVFTDDRIENHQTISPSATFANYGRSQQIQEGSEEARSEVRPNIHFYICEAFDPDSEEYSTEINKYEIKNVIGCKDASCTDSEQIQELGSFKIDEIAEFDKGLLLIVFIKFYYVYFRFWRNCKPARCSLWQTRPCLCQSNRCWESSDAWSWNYSILSACYWCKRFKMWPRGFWLT